MNQNHWRTDSGYFGKHRILKQPGPTKNHGALSDPSNSPIASLTAPNPPSWRLVAFSATPPRSRKMHHRRRISASLAAFDAPSTHSEVLLPDRLRFL
ncbi:hypothetical protein BV20DRAFT_703597 [Pilatotrama ljubarskyi]|nr:hypothetical protein BV20DRAFT_703597 [Pilatotrama ljubarskyi]